MRVCKTVWAAVARSLSEVLAMHGPAAGKQNGALFETTVTQAGMCFHQRSDTAVCIYGAVSTFFIEQARSNFHSARDVVEEDEVG